MEQVSVWQKKLATSDSVISIWFEVQRTWSHLESIFIGSEDIRSQLPEHSKQFDIIDTDFKVDYYLMITLIFLCEYVCVCVCVCMFVCVCACAGVFLKQLITCCVMYCIILDLQELTKDAEKTPNVVKACNKKGLFEELEDLQKRLVS